MLWPTLAELVPEVGHFPGWLSAESLKGVGDPLQPYCFAKVISWLPLTWEPGFLPPSLWGHQGHTLPPPTYFPHPQLRTQLSLCCPAGCALHVVCTFWARWPGSDARRCLHQVAPEADRPDSTLLLLMSVWSASFWISYIASVLNMNESFLKKIDTNLTYGPVI